MQEAGGVGMAGAPRGFAYGSLEGGPCCAYKLLGFFSLELTLRTDKQMLLHRGELCLRESLKQITFQHIIGDMRSDIHVHNNLLALTNELSLSSLLGYISYSSVRRARKLSEKHSSNCFFAICAGPGPRIWPSRGISAAETACR